MSRLLKKASIGEVVGDPISVGKATKSTHAPQFRQLMGKNKFINANFDVWERGDSQTSTGYGSDDRWFNSASGTSFVHTKQEFNLGQTEVPGNPTFFSRTDVTAGTGTDDFAIKRQLIESVRTFSGQTATISFYARADAPKDIALEFIQRFGSGGTPSDDVDSIGITTISLTTTWQYYTATIDFPSIAGKTIGTDGNDSLMCFIWFSGSPDRDPRTNGLAQQSGVFDLSRVQIEEGPFATEFEERSIGQELALCQRYYARDDSVRAWMFNGRIDSGWRASAIIRFPVRMRTVPSVSVEVKSSSASIDETSETIFQESALVAFTQYLGSSASDDGFIRGSYQADAELS